jgi:hypothetical protein
MMGCTTTFSELTIVLEVSGDNTTATAVMLLVLTLTGVAAVVIRPD